MDSLLPNSRPVASTPMAYTDLASLQSIKAEGDKDVALQKVAKQFESMFVGLLFKGMRQANAAFENDAMGGHSNAEKTYRDMYDQQMSMSISNGRGMGIAAMVYRQLKGNVRQQQVADTLDESQMYRPDSIRPSFQGLTKIDPAPVVKEPLANAQKIPTSPQLNGARLDLTKAESPEEFARQLLPVVKQGAKALGLDPLVLVAQAALETGWGKHIIKNSYGKSSNNLFNIKADSRWGGESVKTSTLEFKQGIAVKETAKFRQYASITDSVNDYLDFVKNNPRYEQALKMTGDAHGFIEQLHSAGYATDPQYAEKMKAVLEKLTNEFAEG